MQTASGPASDAAILRLDHVTKRFGGLVAVNDVTFDVRKGEVFALIGPNGAGKTTLFNGVTGLIPPTSGSVVFEGREIAGTKPFKVAELGIARTFQNIRLFEYMSAVENILVGEHCRMHAKLWDSLFKLPRERREEKEVSDRAMELLRFVGIERWAHSYARNLPYGGQPRLEIARALATRPRLLLLDEPAAGFTPQEKVELMLIGSNGAGKTTTLRTISGLMHPANGSITFGGQEITKTRAHEIVALGICQSPEGRRLFPRMQVIDNLRMGAFTRKDKAGIAQDMERVFVLFPRLRERMTQLADRKSTR